MKHSKYNIFVKCEGFTICYNSFTNKYIGLSHNAADVFKQTQDLIAYAQQYPKQYEVLKNLGFIIPDLKDELSLIRMQNKDAAFASRKHYLMVYPTQDCNLKCWYCYESHVKGSRMSEDVMKRIIKYVKTQISNNAFDELRLGYFGGEPLTDFYKIAYPLSLEIKKMVEEAGKTFHTFFVTNASLIDMEMISKFKEINPVFQITLDGNRAKHDTVRIGKEGNFPTYDTIIQAIKGICGSIYNEDKYNIPVLNLRINYDNNTLKHITDIIDDIKDVNRKSLNIHFERVWQTKHLVDDCQRKLLLDTLKKFVDNGFYIGHGCFGNKRVSCPAETSNFTIVNYDGLLYRCNGRTLKPTTKEGFLDEKGILNWDETIRSKRLGLATFENPRCLDCKMLPLCMGPCSQKLWEHNGVDDSICTLSSLDVSLEEYLKFDFEMKYYSTTNNER